MAQYRLISIWRIQAPLEEVYAAIQNSLHWPEWWPGAHRVVQAAKGDADGLNNIRRYSWRGDFSYKIDFEVRATRIERLVAIEGQARGDLEGMGRWHFSRDGAVSVVYYDWQVRSTRWWMNLIAPLARRLFIRNHSRLMRQGAEGLSRLLRSPLVAQKNIDLTV